MLLKCYMIVAVVTEKLYNNYVNYLNVI